MPRNEEELEQEEGLDEEEGAEEAPVEETVSTTSRKSAKTPKRVGSSGLGNLRGRARTNTDGTPNAKWQSTQAELMWPEILDYLNSVGRSPYDVTIQVIRLDPPGPNGAVLMPGGIDGNQVDGSDPGNRLVDRITDLYHLPLARGPATYEVRFLWKAGSGRIGTAKLNLPSPAEIVALRNAAMMSSQQEPQPGVGAPQRQPVQQPQPMQQPPYQQSYPPYMPQNPYYDPRFQPPLGIAWQPPTTGVSEDASALRAELAATRGALNEALLAAREGRQPNIQPSGVAAQPPPPSEDMIVAKVIMALQRAGVIGNTQPQPAAAAPARNDLAGAVDGLLRDVLGGAVDIMKSNIKKSLAGAMGVGGVPEEAAAEPEVTEPADPFAAPFDIAPVSDVKWPNGDPVRYAADKSTGNISPMGLAFGNPYIAEKAMGVANGLVEGLTEALKGFAKNQIPVAGAGKPNQIAPPQAQVVREIPEAATNASPPNGESSGGWPT